MGFILENSSSLIVGNTFTGNIWLKLKFCEFEIARLSMGVEVDEIIWDFIPVDFVAWYSPYVVSWKSDLNEFIFF